MLQRIREKLGFQVFQGVEVVRPHPVLDKWKQELSRGIRLGTAIKRAVRQVSAKMEQITDPHPEPRYETVADHFRGASSYDSKLALLEFLVRASRAEAILEIGTAYGLSGIALTMAQAVPRLTTLDGGEPQATLGPANIRSIHPVGIEAIKGDKNVTLPELASDRRVYDFVFHDGGHDGDGYVRDFGIIHAMVPPGGIYIIDDISWDKKPELREMTRHRSARTCLEGWEDVLRHERVAGALVVNDVGILLLD